MIFSSLPTENVRLTLWRKSLLAKRGGFLVWPEWAGLQIIIYRYLKNRNIIYFKIPAYPELEPKNVWPLINQNEDLMEYFPDLKPSQLPEKEFLYGIMCTLRPDGVRQLVAAGVKNRSPESPEDHGELIEITVELKDAIMNLFAMKSK